MLEWADNEFQKIFKRVNVRNKFNFNGVLIAFFQSYYFNTPEGFFASSKNLLALKIESYNTGAESNIQRTTIHELTHVATSSHSLVGVAISEGIALFVEDLWGKLNGIPFESETRDEGYIFSKNLINSILLKVYNNDLNLFFDRIKKGNEEIFLKDIDAYLKSKNVFYNARELSKISSILFYAKKIPDSPFEEYTKNDEMEILRREILGCFNNENNNTNLAIYDYLNLIKYICSLNEVLKNNLGNFETLSTTLDRELGLALSQDSSSLLLNDQAVINIIKRTFDITNTEEFDYNAHLEDVSKLYPRK